MIYTLTKELQQSYNNNNKTIKIDILFNDSFNYFYFNMFLNGELIKGDTKIVNEFKNNYIQFVSNKADYANYENVDNFSLEFLNE
ncbi:hypothetical protein [Aliarcobacter butzleri]|uniref:hypothetical protein n=1 Tax=Aliarcobacter butzleri TaxID=28197 RepID=UPI00125FBD25|nr:hypothetical protein [Aliarcobacter butzleri]